MILFFIFLILIGISVILYSGESSYFFTPFIAVMIWVMYLLFNLIFNQDFRFFFSGTIFIGYAVAIFGLGSILGQITEKSFFHNNKNKNHLKLITALSGWHYLAIASIALTLFGLIALINYSFQEFQLLENVFSLLLLPQEFASDRYGGAQYLPMELRLLSYMIYPASLSIGALVGAKCWHPITRVIPIILALSYGVIYSSRTVFILTIVLLISSELSIRAINEERSNFQIKKLLSAFGFFIIGIPLVFIMLQWLRQGVSSEFILNEMLHIARISMTGSLSAFTQWFHHYDGIGLEWGKNTFAGPFELLGIANRVQGFYLDFIEVGKSHINIYTAFRGLLQDYGFYGSTLFLFIMGAIASLLFFRVQKGWIVGVPILSVINGWIIFSPIISLFVNNSIIGGYILFFIFSFYPLKPLAKLINKTKVE